MKGRRIDYNPALNSDYPFPQLTQDGDYGKDKDGLWYCRCPGGFIGNLYNHQVTEHEDGTITVRPSILVSEATLAGSKSYHGWLTKGEWSEC